ncbi:MAG: hypothetical protein NZ523_01170 [Elioraea sp.]|nr:hypothetical protein [Elioraea sp.]
MPLFGIGTTIGFGPAVSSIHAMTIAAPPLAVGTTEPLVVADLPQLHRDLRTSAVPEVDVDRR